MLDSKIACDLIRKLDGVTEKVHFGADAFSANKKVFATVWHEDKKVNLRFSPEQQRYFLEADSEAFAEIDNAWGRQGWTSVLLKYIDRKLFAEAVQAAWAHSQSKSLSSKGATA